VLARVLVGALAVELLAGACGVGVAEEGAGPGGRPHAPGQELLALPVGAPPDVEQAVGLANARRVLAAEEEPLRRAARVLEAAQAEVALGGAVHAAAPVAARGLGAQLRLARARLALERRQPLQRFVDLGRVGGAAFVTRHLRLANWRQRISGEKRTRSSSSYFT